MSHARKQIRDAVVTLLTGLSATGSRVYVGRARPLPEGHDPTLLVYTPVEESSRDAMGRPPSLARGMTLLIEIRVSQFDPPDDAMDAIAAEVEAKMAIDLTLEGRCRNVQYVGAQQDVEAIGKSHLGGLRLEYRMTYRTLEGQPDTFV